MDIDWFEYLWQALGSRAVSGCLVPGQSHGRRRGVECGSGLLPWHGKGPFAVSEGRLAPRRTVSPQSARPRSRGSGNTENRATQVM